MRSPKIVAIIVLVSFTKNLYFPIRRQKCVPIWIRCSLSLRRQFSEASSEKQYVQTSYLAGGRQDCAKIGSCLSESANDPQGQRVAAAYMASGRAGQPSDRL